MVYVRQNRPSMTQADIDTAVGIEHSPSSASRQPTATIYDNTVIHSQPVTATRTEPIYYRGMPHRAAKLYQGSTHRVCSPEETYDRIAPVLPRAGITRMADVTGLDRIGIPTILAMRPNAPTLSNSSGKGFTKTAAMVSAAMEGIELFCAEEERFDFEMVTASYNDLLSDGVTLPEPDLLALSLHSLFNPQVQERWAIGWDLIGQREMAVPFEMVTMVPVLGDTPARFNFQIGSNGLASGNVFLEAVCSGLSEVIERDSVTCSNIASGYNMARLSRIDTATISYDSVQELLCRLSAKGISAVLFDCTADTNVPTYEVYLVDNDIPSTGLFRGYGAHLHPEIAMLRAFTEAVQSRAVYIAGSRDDIMTYEHRRMRQRPSSQIRELADDKEHAIPFIRTSRATDSFEGDCQALLDSLVGSGIESAVVFDLSWPELGVSVIRVVVPGLEGYGSFPYYNPGQRARAAAELAMQAATFKTGAQ